MKVVALRSAPKHLVFPVRLAIIISHPIQYYSPWFRFLAAHGIPDLRVFYLWNGGATSQWDRGFGRVIQWDVPLLEGYDHEFVPNVAREPGTHHRAGLDNPALAERLSSFRPDSLLLFGYNYLTHHRLIFAKKRVPIIFRGDSHRLVKSDGLKAWLKRFWIARVYSRISAFLPVGQANAQYFRHHGVPDQKLFFAPHAVDNARFRSQEAQALLAAADWKRELGIPPGKKVILFAGKFEMKKRPLDLLSAFQAADLKDAVLLLVGNGGLEQQIRERAASMPHVFIAPFQNQTQMPRTYLAGDLFVYPSHGSGETWGLAVNEAMCLGRPIIVSHHVGCAPDLVKPHQNGLVFPAGDVNALAQALRTAFAEPSQLERWGQTSREIISHYDYAHASKGLREAMLRVGERAKP